MPREIYNEGRVQGMSAYEVYVREHIGEDPNTPPASEREWLAASLASGSSLLYKFTTTNTVPSDEEWLHEIQLPEGSRLGAANTIIASLFNGQANTDINGWANRVTDYGDLIVNDASLSNTTASKTDIGKWSERERIALENYMHIVDGVVLQPGRWTSTNLGGDALPKKDLSPDLSEKPFIRLKIRGSIKGEFYILFTGFTIRTVLSGSAGLDGSTQTNMSADGDFLGPAVYPWANKIIFSVPNSFVSYFMSNAYKRKITGTEGQTQDVHSKWVNDDAVIDMKTTDPGTYYKTKHSDARQTITVDDVSTLGDGKAVLTVYQRSEMFPPSLWGTYVHANGEQYLNPIDIVAPGTIKIFENGSETNLKEYEKTFPGTVGMTKNDDGTVGVLDKNDKLVPMAKVTHKPIVTDGGANSGAQAVVTQTGNNQEISLSMGQGGSGTQYTISANPSSTLPKDDIRWADMLQALVEDKAIDILGSRLKSMKETLVKSETDGCPYIEFGPSNNTKRLYISNTKPTGSIPIGSIGIGWTE